MKAALGWFLALVFLVMAAALIFQIFNNAKEKFLQGRNYDGEDPMMPLLLLAVLTVSCGAAAAVW